MWVEGKWFEECQLPDYLKSEREKAYREGYTAAVAVTADNFTAELQRFKEERKELIDLLMEVCECATDSNIDTIKLRLKELRNKKFGEEIINNAISSTVI